MNSLKISNSNNIDQKYVTVIIPTLNEEQAIGLVLNQLKDEGFHNILVVDGNSDDFTVDIAKKLGTTVLTQNGKGKTGAIQTAIDYAKTPYLVILDGDSTYDPRNINSLLENVKMFNQVIGARKDQHNINGLNRFGNKVISQLFNLLFGTKLTDVCSGMYALKSEYAKSLTLYTEGFDVEIEIAAHSANCNSIKEVPISYNKRVGIQKLKPFKDGYRIILTILDLGRKYRPIVFYSYLTAGILLLSGLIINIWNFLIPLSSTWQIRLGVINPFFLAISAPLIALGYSRSRTKSL